MLTPGCPDCGSYLELQLATEFIWTFVDGPPAKLRDHLRRYGRAAFVWVCPWCIMPHWELAL